GGGWQAENEKYHERKLDPQALSQMMETMTMSSRRSPFAVPKIADFGVAKRLDKQSMHTATGAVLGTPNYMAPEQAWGSDKRRPIGAPADVYALGAILYEMITGRPPFLGETPLDTLQQVVMQDPVAPTRLQPKVPKDLETICLKCLQKEPTRRYVSASALADDLHRYLEDRPILAKPAGAMTRLRRWRKRNPAVAALLIISLLLLAAGTAISTYFAVEASFAAEQALANADQAKKNEDKAENLASQAKKNLQVAEENAKEAKKQQAFAEANLKEAKDNAKLAQDRLELHKRLQYTLQTLQISVASKALDENNFGNVVDVLESMVPGKSDNEDLRGFEWFHMRQRLGGKPLTVAKAHDGPIMAVACSPDGNLVAIGPALLNKQDGGAGCDIRVRDAQTGRLLHTLKGHTKSVNSLAFSRDGKRLASASDDRTIMVWNPTQEKPNATLKGHAGEVTCVQFSPDGKYLASASVDKSVRVWDVSSAVELWVLSDLPEAVEWVAFHPSGDLIAGACRDGTIMVWDTHRLQPLTRMHGQGNRIANLAWHPKDKQLVLIANDGTIYLWDVARTDRAVLMPTSYGAVKRAAISTDGNYVAIVSDDNALRLYNVATKTHIKNFSGQGGDIQCLGFNVDGTLLASGGADGTVTLRPFRIKPASTALMGHTGDVADVCWSADGTVLASCRMFGKDPDGPNAGSEVMLWNLATGRQPDKLTAHLQRVYRAAFQPKGKLLATASRDGTIRLWDTTTRTDKILYQQDLPCRALAWSPDGTSLAATCDLEESGEALTRITIWQAASGDIIHSFRDNQYWIESLVWSRDGKWLAGASIRSSDIRLWNVETRALEHLFTGHQDFVNGLAFSPDGRWLASAGNDKTARLWDMRDKQKLPIILKGHDNAVLAVAFHPKDNKRLATGSSDATVKLWDLGSFQEIYTMSDHTGAVTAVAFRPDGYQLATASRDTTLRIWDATPLPEDLNSGKK
ncbi:MAG TPA: protein kinase, partial [Gemmataceae bacterium]|nr:protein kinase [Gemmataceae bacterium]